jgi:co-chaperonin GroES (HSP10)
MKEELVLLRKDVLLKPYDYDKVNPSNIIVVEDEKQTDKAMGYYEVLKTSSDVTEVKPGDVVVLEFRKHTIPMRWEGDLCAITSEEDIVAVLE